MLPHLTLLAASSLATTLLTQSFLTLATASCINRCNFLKILLHVILRQLVETSDTHHSSYQSVASDVYNYPQTIPDWK